MMDSNKRITVDGQYGISTRNAIKDFQREYNVKYPDQQIAEDGGFGPETRDALQKYIREATDPG